LTFESAIAPDPALSRHSEERSDEESPRAASDAANDELADLEAQIAPLQAQMDQLIRQFWVTREQVKANKYDLSASRYRQVEQDEAYYEKPQVTMERLLELERVMGEEIQEIEELLS